jgi:NADPH:quinone reductase-like Zn-dependent oxidoreductase
VNVRGSGAVVTGGGNGIGRALARRLAAAGARVVVNDRNPRAAEAVATETGGWAAPADVSTEAGVRDLIAAAREHVGQIEIYCSNAGVAGRRDRRGQHGRDMAALVGRQRDGPRSGVTRAHPRLARAGPRPLRHHRVGGGPAHVGLHWGLYATKEPTAIRDCHDQLLKLAAAGAIKPLVSERLGLADVIAGLERLAAGTTIGRPTFLP